MSYIVPRTCTEITQGDDARENENNSVSVPLEKFRDERAYALLGDPGSGKTTAFEDQCKKLGNAAFLITGRDFLTFDPQVEWRKKTIFIDGLDEIRSGPPDPRTPLDRVRQRLDNLGRPPFRISCREADWLGKSDRDHLARVAENSQVKVLRLDPLTTSDVEHILSDRPSLGDVQRFIEKAQELGIYELLLNPQTLNMLADVVSRSGGWPESRLEIFEKACKEMSKEHNSEHMAGDNPPPPEELMSIAGHMCAIHLISGSAGYSLNHDEASTDYITLDRCGYAPIESLRHALSTKLFKGKGNGHFTPIHRHAAEFLAARRLAQIINDGLPARRILSLITGGDGVVVTELRGLSGWLAAHCEEARGNLIEGDPIGVALYGDIRPFTSGEKRKLLMSLNRKVSGLGDIGAFGPLAAPDMESVLRDILTDPCRDTDHQLVVEFVLRLLQTGTPLPGLSEILFRIVHDDSWWPRVTSSALDTFVHNTDDDVGRAEKLKQLLAEIQEGQVSDPDKELLGELLTQLYPQEIPPSRIWTYLTEAPSELLGRYLMFRERRLLNQSSDEDVAILLDHLHERFSDLRPALELNHLDHFLLGNLLYRGLQEHGERLETTRLYNWLSASSFGGSSAQVSAWLEQRPEVLKAVFLEGLSRCPDNDDFFLCSSYVWQSLCGSRLPPDFGIWCLEHAVKLVDTHVRASEYLLEHAFRSDDQGINNQDLARSILVERTCGHKVLEEKLKQLIDPPTNSTNTKRQQIAHKLDEQQRRKQERIMLLVRPNAEALRANRAAPTLLYEIGRTYLFLHQQQLDDTTPKQRFAELLGNDDDLVEAALTGLHKTIWREDVPEAEEIVRLKSRSQIHYLSYPFIAGMDEIDLSEPALLDQLAENQKRKALALYYCCPTGRGQEAEWYLRWLNSFPEIVEDVLIRCAISDIRTSREHIPSLYNLAYSKNHNRVARRASLHLLEAFPVRCNSQQISALDYLLWAALQHADRASLKKLIKRRLSRKSMNTAQRVHWLAVGVVASQEMYRRPLEEFTAVNESRIRQLAAFFCPTEPSPFLVEDLDADTLKILIGLMGRSFGPFIPDGSWRRRMEASIQIPQLINRLATLPGRDATDALQALSSDAAIDRWHDHLQEAQDRQTVIHRDAYYDHPSVEEIRNTMSNQTPANAGDLAALLSDRLNEMADRIHNGNTDDWRQYWNENPRRQPDRPKHEDSCRDALLSDLRETLPDGADAQREGSYARDTRSDIRIDCQSFNVPIEIKKSNHPNLWSAIRNQLIDKYTADPATRGYGIYLVFWFGKDYVTPPPQGNRPTTSGELRECLEAILTEEEARKVTVCIIDVSPVHSPK